MTDLNSNQKFIFLSYAHRDSDKVLPIFAELEKRGYRIWYDDGLRAGDDWAEILAEKLNSCSLFIAFVSEAYVQSQNCKREVNFAVDANKDMFCIYIEDVVLTPGLKLQLGTTQSVFKEKLDLTSFTEKIFSSPIMMAEDLRMSIEEFNLLKNKVDAPSLVKEMCVAIGICKHDGKVLMVRRTQPEGNLCWQFPATIIKPNNDIKARLEKGVFEETGIRTQYTNEIGRRLHPDTGMSVRYCAMDYISGEANNGDEDENESVEWVSVSEYKNYITSNLFKAVTDYIEEME